MKTSHRLVMLSWVILLAIIIQDAFAITKVALVDHSDPDYMDRCLEITGELCDYCCLVDFEWCSRDIYNCQPTFNRNLIKMYQAGMILGGIICGFPLLVYILHTCMIYRFCVRCFPTTGGTSCFEGCYRLNMIICCCKRFNQTYPLATHSEEDEINGQSEKAGCCKRIFCCCCCRRKGKGA